MRVYIAGPMTGLPDFNRAAFKVEAARLEDAGHVAVDPSTTDPRHAGPCLGGPVVSKRDHAGHLHHYGCWLRASLARMLTCRRVVMLPGWEASNGATLEHAIATASGMTIEYREKD